MMETSQVVEQCSLSVNNTEKEELAMGNGEIMQAPRPSDNPGSKLGMLAGTEQLSRNELHV